jgi:UDP-glucose 4-epimerase
VSSYLVTGGAGFIGSHLVERLLDRGFAVRVLDDLSTGRLENLGAVSQRVVFFPGSVTDERILAEAVAQVDVVFHLAALPSVRRSIEDPLATHYACATGTLRVLEAARRASVRRVVYAASSSAYGGTPGECRQEEDPLAPLSPYAAAKLAGEHYCQCFTAVFALETVRLRFFNVFGPRQRADSPYSGVIPLFIDALQNDRQPVIYGDGQQSRDFTYVVDAVQALEKAAAAPLASGRVYNIGGGNAVSVLSVLSQLGELLGKRMEPLFGPDRPGDVRHSRADLRRSGRELDYRPEVAFAEGLRRTVSAFAAERQTRPVGN